MDGSDPKNREGERYRGPQRSAPYPMSRLAPAHDLIDMAREIQSADEAIATATAGKLEMIARQIRALQHEARAVLDKAQQDHDLHRARCNFQRRPGRIYHLYRRPEGQTYFSMLSPAEWGHRPPHEFLGSYRLEADRSWTPAEQAEERDREGEALTRLLCGPKS
ncbi:MAG: DUF2452 domain-containing protein [Myxococcales bacterium]|nr:DUF2452 domain-containing protein [Myxococcales bacterium]